MAYAGDRLVHDADAHLMEPAGFYEQYADPGIRTELARGEHGSKGREYAQIVEPLLAKRNAPDAAASADDELMLRKNLDAMGSFLPEERCRALNLLGFASQLIFTTSFLRSLTEYDRDGSPELAYGAARAHNRAITEFCRADPRLLPVCWIPLQDIGRTEEFVAETLERGAAALMVPSICPRQHGPSHIGFEPLWAQAAEAGVPIVYHVGGGRPMDPVYKYNGLPPVKDFRGGDGNFTSVSFMAIPEAPMQTLAALVFDGVFERHPRLRVGVIEQGAHWLPGWMRSLDSGAEAFSKNEERIKKLSLKPSEYVQRQIRVTPYPHEDTNWVIDNAGQDVCMFSSDYPHVEGGRNPLKRFETNLAGRSEVVKERFYVSNFADLMGPTLDRVSPAA